MTKQTILRRGSAALVLLGFAVAGGLAAALDSYPTEGDVRVENCLVSLIEDLQIAAQEPGLVIQVKVAEGAEVEPKQLLAQIDDRRAQMRRTTADMELKVAQKRAASSIDVQYAEASRNVAKAEYERAILANQRRPGTIPESDVRRRRLSLRRAELEIEKAKMDLDVAKMAAGVRQTEVTAADVDILRRQVVAPIGGVVVGVYKRAGEWVQAGDPVLRLARLNKLRVEGLVDASRHNPEELVDRPVTVEVTRARGQVESFSGRIVFVSPLLRAGRRYRVLAEVDNRKRGGVWILRPGGDAVMTIKRQ